MTTATNRFTTNTGFLTVEPQGIVPPGVTIISLEKPTSPESIVQVIYAPADNGEYHKTCKVTKDIYDMLRHERNHQ